MRATLPPHEEFWKHGYRRGYEDAMRGSRHRLDDAPTSVTDDKLWTHGYDLGHEHGAGYLPSMLDVLGRDRTNVIEFRPRTSGPAS